MPGNVVQIEQIDGENAVRNTTNLDGKCYGTKKKTCELLIFPKTPALPDRSPGNFTPPNFFRKVFQAILPCPDVCSRKLLMLAANFQPDKDGDGEIFDLFDTESFNFSKHNND